jgi:hypothetical protein
MLSFSIPHPPPPQSQPSAPRTSLPPRPHPTPPSHLYSRGSCPCARHVTLTPGLAIRPRLPSPAWPFAAAAHRGGGQVFTYEEIKAAVEKHQPRVMALVHAETSTGACQPFDGVGELCRKHGVILIADTVTSISGVPLYVDKWGIDAVYAGTQKALSCPPGVSPMSFSQAAMDKLLKRKTAVPNWYLDMKMVASYLTQTGGGARSYHHTAPIRCYARPPLAPPQPPLARTGPVPPPPLLLARTGPPHRGARLPRTAGPRGQATARRVGTPISARACLRARALNPTPPHTRAHPRSQHVLRDGRAAR